LGKRGRFAKVSLAKPEVKDNELVKSRKTPFFVIPAPHQVRDKLQPESSKFNTF